MAVVYQVQKNYNFIKLLSESLHNIQSTNMFLASTDLQAILNSFVHELGQVVMLDQIKL